MNDELDGIDGSDKLVALMRAAASVQDAPPPAFDHSDVLAGSHRITRRNRMIAAGATGLVLIASLGTAAVLPMLSGADGPSSTVAEAPRTPTTAPAAAPAAPSSELFAPAPAPSAGARSAAPAQPAPKEAPAPSPAPQAPPPGDGGPPPPPAPTGGGARDDRGSGGVKPDNGAGHGGGVKPRDEPAEPQPAEGGGAGGNPPPAQGCQAGQAPNLSAIVSEVVPEASGGSQSCRSNGDSALDVRITKDGKTGILTVVFSPNGGGTPSGTTATTASGGTVGVSVRSTGDGPAPYADELGRIASELASRL
ncbi:hypothetical protein ACQEVB_09150 [Pseudonocardia sp. CA-107938]|uniref:hypothetical protein n=1 Tax=Pseudonocardia sp. CA-107938 TaxID=3240021 RepID=UPI003D8CB144